MHIERRNPKTRDNTIAARSCTFFQLHQKPTGKLSLECDSDTNECATATTRSLLHNEQCTCNECNYIRITRPARVACTHPARLRNEEKWKQKICQEWDKKEKRWIFALQHAFGEARERERQIFRTIQLDNFNYDWERHAVTMRMHEYNLILRTQWNSLRLFLSCLLLFGLARLSICRTNRAQAHVKFYRFTITLRRIPPTSSTTWHHQIEINKFWTNLSLPVGKWDNWRAN